MQKLSIFFKIFYNLKLYTILIYDSIYILKHPNLLTIALFINIYYMAKLKHIIKNQDLFGYTVDLNFNKAGHSHNTIIGGLISICLKLLLIVYVIYLFNKMLGYNENIIYHIGKELDLDQLGVVDYDAMKFSLVPMLIHSRT